MNPHFTKPMHLLRPATNTKDAATRLKNAQEQSLSIRGTKVTLLPPPWEKKADPAK